ncbi:cilia- and flagella-associated protein 45-like [Diorhabda sublineata]|uniref:cilia- and flagella-associated protein 45-like n=1 Tax=Diorhabda sublineata TaxID=1163346 RepID=UPI0024E0E988|nr:cilia- and flagella-associated protein 45-like [Diorhabda sublineata]
MSNEKLYLGKQPIKISADIFAKECDPNLEYIHHKPSRATETKVTMVRFDKDIIRELVVPDKEPIEYPAVLSKGEYERLKKQAKPVSLEEKMRKIREAEQQKMKIQQESLDRKERLMATQKTQQALPGTKLNAVESEAAKNNLYLKQRSEELMIEQDDKVKQISKIILAAKCRAIRNAQIAEKKLIEKQLREENERLDKMAEQTRQKNIRSEEKRRAEAEIKRQRYVKEVQEQVQENEMNQLLEAEKIEEESRMINRALIAWQKEEELKAVEKKNVQSRLKKELDRANEEAEYYKALRGEEDRIADMRIMEFIKSKQRREEALEREKTLMKQTKEREIARMVESQGKSQDLKALMDELNAARAQEAKEKEWREKEKQEAMKKQRVVEDLKKSRAEQIEYIRKAQAVALARDEEAFRKVVATQKQLHDVDVKKQRKRIEDTEKHRKFLLKQINEKEKERIKYRQEKFEDGKAQRQEYMVKNRRIEEYLQQKIDRLKQSNLPESYVKEIERQMKFVK